MNLLPNLLLFGTFQGLILAGVLLKSGLKKSASLGFLLSVLVLSSGYLLYEYFVFERYLKIYPHLIGVYLPVLFLIPPLIYGFVKLELSYNYQWKPKHLLHLMPFFIVFLVMIPFYASPMEDKLRLLLSHRSAWELYPFRKILSISLWFSGVFYGIWIFQLVKDEKSKKVRWIKVFSYLFLGLLLSLLIANSFTQAGVHHREVMVFSLVTFSFLIHYISFSALQQSKIFSTSLSKSDNILKDQTRIILKAKILSLLEEEKVFKNAKISSDEFCEKLEINKRYFSHFINTEFNSSFTHFLNSYRIEEAKKMLLDDQYRHLNFTGIANEVGFSNRNSFTRAFKRHTGITPSQFVAIQKQ